MKILLIEDDKECALFVRRALEKKFGCEVNVAENGVRGLFYFNKNLPDILLLDIALPVMNGFEMMNILNINKNTKLPPIIVVSALWEKDLQEKLKDIDIFECLPKPIQMPRLIETIEEALGLNENSQNSESQLRQLEN